MLFALSSSARTAASQRSGPEVRSELVRIPGIMVATTLKRLDGRKYARLSRLLAYRSTRVEVVGHLLPVFGSRAVNRTLFQLPTTPRYISSIKLLSLRVTYTVL